MTVYSEIQLDSNKGNIFRIDRYILKFQDLYLQTIFKRSFSPRFECNTTSGWLNQNYNPKDSLFRLQVLGRLKTLSKGIQRYNDLGPLTCTLQSTTNFTRNECKYRLGCSSALSNLCLQSSICL